jgi:hypothetical protein
MNFVFNKEGFVLEEIEIAIDTISKFIEKSCDEILFVNGIKNNTEDLRTILRVLEKILQKGCANVDSFTMSKYAYYALGKGFLRKRFIISERRFDIPEFTR